MNAAYKPIHQQADRLHHKTEAMIDDRSNPMAETISREARNILEDIESDKGPRSVEDRIKRLQQQLERLKDTPTSAISANDADSLQDSYEQLRGQLRRLSNY
jgi:plasmid stabilization system protein ParE